MKAFRYAFVFAVTGSLSLAACGDDSGGDDDGSAGKGGTSSAGTAGAGGNTAGTTSAGGTSAGTSNTGGSTGGTNASGGSGGGGTVSGCPGSAPQDGDTCDPDTVDGQCRYTGVACTCGGGFGGGDEEWNCTGDGDECPSTPPADGDACDMGGGGGDGPGGPPGGGLNCPYPTVTCTCGGFGPNAGEWSCEDFEPPPECPTTAPNDGDECEGPLNCPDIGCNCGFNGEWNCDGGGFGGDGPGFP